MLRSAPARHLSGHLMWTYHGTVWAVWGITPTTYYYLTTSEKKSFWNATSRALTRLPHTWKLLSLCARIDAETVVERTLSGLPTDQISPHLSAKAQAQLDLLDDEMYERQFYLAAQLDDAGQGWSASIAANTARLRRVFGLTPQPVTVADRTAATAAAAKLEESIGAHLPLRRVTAGELVWMMDRFPRRGLDEPLLEDYQQPQLFAERVGESRDPSDATAPLRGPCLAGVVDDPVYREGGARRSPTRRDLARKTYVLPRYLQVQVAAHPTGEAHTREDPDDLIGHQTFVVQHSLPSEFVFPGSEWFAAVDHVPFPVDWVICGQSTPNNEAMRRNATAKRHLVGQHEQWRGATTGMPAELHEAHEAAEAEELALAEDRGAPELEIVAVFAAWHEDPVECARRGRILADQLSDREYGVARPIGRQEECYWSFWPGQPTSTGLHRAYRQWMMPADLAAFMPLAGSALGDPTGALIGYSLDGVVLRPVLLDPARGTALEHRKSGNICLLGTMGGGKSYCMKRFGEEVLDRDGRLIILDRTPRAEWSTWATDAARNPAIVRLTGGGLNFDPLKVFRHLPDACVRYTVGYLTQLTGVEPRSVHGNVLKEAVKAVALAHGGINDVVDLLLEMGTSDTVAREVGARAASLRTDDLAKIVFGDGAVPQLADHDAVVFACPELTLPTREDLASEYARRNLSDEQVHSQALLYLLTAVARHTAFDEVTTFTALVLDEAWALCDSAEGQALLKASLRDGSKHNHGVWVSSQTVETFGDDVLGLFGRWALFRCARRAAERTLTALGVDASSDLVERFDSLDAGQCLMSDLDGRIGMVQIAPSALHHLAARTDLGAALQTHSTGSPGGSGSPLRP